MAPKLIKPERGGFMIVLKSFAHRSLAVVALFLSLSSFYSQRAYSQNSPDVVHLNKSVVIDKGLERLAGKGPGSYGGGMADGMKIRALVNLFSNNIEDIKAELIKYLRIIEITPVSDEKKDYRDQISKLLSQGLAQDISEGRYHLKPQCFDQSGRERDASTMIVDRTGRLGEIESPFICINLRSLAAKVVGKDGIDRKSNQLYSTYSSGEKSISIPDRDMGQYNLLAGLLVHEHARHFNFVDTIESLDINPLGEFIAGNYLNVNLFASLNFLQELPKAGFGIAYTNFETEWGGVYTEPEVQLDMSMLEFEVLRASDSCSSASLVYKPKGDRPQTVPLKTGERIRLSRNFQTQSIKEIDRREFVNILEITLPKDPRQEFENCEYRDDGVFETTGFSIFKSRNKVADLISCEFTVLLKVGEKPIWSTYRYGRAINAPMSHVFQDVKLGLTKQPRTHFFIPFNVITLPPWVLGL